MGPCLWGFASCRPMLSKQPCLWIGPRLLGAGSLRICKRSAVVGGSRVYGDLQLWSAVLGFVWWEPCLWRFAALAPNEAQNCRPKLQISMDTAPTKRGSKLPTKAANPHRHGSHQTRPITADQSSPNEAQNCRPKLQIPIDTAPTKPGQ